MQRFFMRTSKTDQIAQMCRLIWVFFGCTCQKVHFLTLWLILLARLFSKKTTRYCHSSAVVCVIVVQKLGHFVISLSLLKIFTWNYVVWSESSQDAVWTVKDAKILHEDKQDRSDCTDVQADLSFLWVHMSESTLSHFVTNFISSAVFEENNEVLS